MELVYITALAFALTAFSIPSIAAGQCRSTSTDPQCKVKPVVKPTTTRKPFTPVTKCDFLPPSTTHEGCPAPKPKSLSQADDLCNRGDSRRENCLF